jgi:hypothetical protein
MKRLLISSFLFAAILSLNSCTIETTKKSNGIKIEISTDDELVINGEKITSKKAEKELKKLIKELEKEGLNKEEIKSTLNSGKESLQEALDDLKKELEEIKVKKKRNKGEN